MLCVWEAYQHGPAFKWSRNSSAVLRNVYSLPLGGIKLIAFSFSFCSAHVLVKIKKNLRKPSLEHVGNMGFDTLSCDNLTFFCTCMCRQYNVNVKICKWSNWGYRKVTLWLRKLIQQVHGVAQVWRLPIVAYEGISWALYGLFQVTDRLLANSSWSRTGAGGEARTQDMMMHWNRWIKVAQGI